MSYLPAMPASNNTKESLVMRFSVHEALTVYLNHYIAQTTLVTF